MDVLHNQLTGKWIVLYPDHQLHSKQQRTIYIRIQDSIVAQSALKLVELTNDGKFRQVDSIGYKGRWGIGPDSVIFIQEGGKGFDNFKADFTKFNDGTLLLTEYVKAEGETIELIWHLKKLTGDVAALLDEDKNKWRHKPTKPESESEIRQRLYDMLQYYSSYYEFVAKEAIFFVDARVLLPFNYYQHAMGLKPIEEPGYFNEFFYNKEQAEQAWHYLDWAMDRLSNKYPSSDNYVKEYAAFMNQLAESVTP